MIDNFNREEVSSGMDFGMVLHNLKNQTPYYFLASRKNLTDKYKKKLEVKIKEQNEKH